MQLRQGAEPENLGADPVCSEALPQASPRESSLNAVLLAWNMLGCVEFRG